MSFSQRWLIGPARSGLVWSATSLIVLYGGVCLVHGFVWTMQLLPTYGLLIIRLAVAAALGVVSLFTLPFQNLDLMLTYASYVAPGAFAVGYVVGLVKCKDPVPSEQPSLAA